MSKSNNLDMFALEANLGPVTQGFSWTEIRFGHFVRATQILFGHLEFF